MSGGMEDMEDLEAQSNPSVTTMEEENQGRCRVEYIGLEGEAEMIAESRRSGRKYEADDFRKEYYYGRCNDTKTCIWPGGGRQSWSNDPSSGITWVGVHGKDSICVVAKTGDLDLSRVHGMLIFCLADEVYRNFRRAVISELEDLADPCSELRKKLDKRKKLEKCIKTPFGVVSVVPSSDKIKKASCYDYVETKFTQLLLEKDLEEEQTSSDDDSDLDMNDPDARIKYSVKLMRRRWRTAPLAKDLIPGFEEEKTVKYIQDKMKRGEAITINEIDQESGDKRYVKKATSFLEKKMESTKDFRLEETVKTAISAFQRLFNKKFKANQIQVSVMDPRYFLSAEVRFRDIYVNHLETIEIEEYLSGINDQELRVVSDNRQKRQRKRSRR